MKRLRSGDHIGSQPTITRQFPVNYSSAMGFHQTKWARDGCGRGLKGQCLVESTGPYLSARSSISGSDTFIM